jgi:hypothetical protein
LKTRLKIKETTYDLVFGKYLVVSFRLQFVDIKLCFASQIICIRKVLAEQFAAKISNCNSQCFVSDCQTCVLNQNLCFIVNVSCKLNVWILIRYTHTMEDVFTYVVFVFFPKIFSSKPRQWLQKRPFSNPTFFDLSEIWHSERF